jgi:predicted  nucleic acid-binding Zn-ribbon protein
MNSRPRIATEELHMAGPGPVLKESHRLRQLLHDLDTRIAQAPRQLQLQKSKLQQADDVLKKFQDDLKHLKVKIHDREVSIKTMFQQIAKWEKQRETVENKKEYDALNTEIADAKQRITAFEEEVLTTMGEVDDQTAKLPAVEKTTKGVRDEVANYEKDYQARLDRYQQERDRARGELTEVEKNVPDDIRPIYEKMTTAKGVEALAAIEGRICSACYTEVTPQMGNEINRGAFVLCKSCGRMLYA